MMDQFRVGHCQVRIIRGDITKAEAECIVNSANNHFWMGAGVAGAIKKAAGQAVEAEAMAQGPREPGEAVFTSAGQLSYAGIIHAAVMGQDLHTDENLVRRALHSTLSLALKHNIRTIAIPAFGTGVGAFSHHICAKSMLEETVDFLLKTDKLELVLFVLYDDNVYNAFSERLNTLFHR